MISDIHLLVDLVSYVNDHDLEQLRLVSHLFHEIINSDQLWKTKLIDTYGLSSLLYNKTDWKDYYLKLVNLSKTVYRANVACKEGKLFLLEYFEKHGVFPNQDGIDLAAGDGHLDIVKWGYQRNITPMFGISRAAQNGHLHILKWWPKTHSHSYQQWTNEAIDGGQIKVLSWLLGKGIKLGSCQVSNIIWKGNLDLVIWLTKKENPIPPQSNWVQTAITSGHLHIIQWLETQVPLPDSYYINICKPEHKKIVKWMAHRNIFPNQESVNIINEITLIKWFEQWDLSPDESGINRILWYGKIDSAEYLMERGIFPTQNGIDTCLMLKNGDVMKFLTKYELRPSQHIIDTISPMLDPQTIEWLAGF